MRAGKGLLVAVLIVLPNTVAHAQEVPDERAYLADIDSAMREPSRLTQVETVLGADGALKNLDTRWSKGLPRRDTTPEAMGALHQRVEDALVPRPSQFEPSEIRRRLAKLLDQVLRCRAHGAPGAIVHGIPSHSGIGGVSGPRGGGIHPFAAVSSSSAFGGGPGSNRSRGAYTYTYTHGDSSPGRPPTGSAGGGTSDGTIPRIPTSGDLSLTAAAGGASAERGQGLGQQSLPPPDRPPAPPLPHRAPPGQVVTAVPERGLSLIQMLLCALAAAGVGGAAVILVSRQPEVSPPRPPLPRTAADLLDPADRGLDVAGITREGRRASVGHDWLKAMRYVFAALLAHLAQRRAIPIARSHTNGEIARMAGSQPALAAAFWSAAAIFEVFWYGQRPATEGDFHLLETFVAACMRSVPEDAREEGRP